ncbi:MAG: thiamine pyrophosphate-binding protein [Thermoleophilia bacterium]|nr:thiamine pyrophosphate-binding protein [Thermoleophilia bacterium]
MDTAEWLLRALAAEGVTHLFGNPGSTELPLLDALPRQHQLRYVLGLHEAAVMGMADGYAQASGRIAAVNVHVQPGIANAVSGVLNAARARTPLLVTVGQQVTALRDAAPFLGGDVLGPVAGLVKWSGEVSRASELPDAMRAAVRAARTPPRGPVLLSLPMDVLVDHAPPVHDAVGGDPPQPPESGPLTAMAVLLDEAERPAVLAGDGVVHEDATELVAALAERLGAPVWGEPQANRVPLPWDHPLWRGQLPPFAAQIRPALRGHDVVIALGMPVFRVFGDSPGPALTDATRLLHVDVDPREIGRTAAPAVGVCASVAETLRRLLDALGPAPERIGPRRDRAAHEVAAARAAAIAGLPGPRAGHTIGPPDLSRAIAAAVRDDDLLVDESLTSGRALRTVLTRRPGTWLAHRGSALGWGLPAAVGAKLADPSRHVMALQGDGSLLFGVHALWTAAREGLGVALVVADNGGYEILRAGMEGLTGRPDGDWPGLALDAPRLDLTAICTGLGATTARVADARELPGALTDLRARAAHGPAVLVADVHGHTPAVGYPVTPGA